MYTIFLRSAYIFFGDGGDITPAYTEIAGDKHYFLENIDKILLGAILCEQENILIKGFDLSNFTQKEANIYVEQLEKTLKESNIFKDAIIEVSYRVYNNGCINIKITIENFDPLNVLKDL